MKKRRSSYYTLAAILILCVICGFGIGGNQTSGAFYLSVRVDSAGVYGIHFEYSINGEPTGGGVIGNADGSEIAVGDTLEKDFISSDFPDGADLTGFSVSLFAVMKDGSELPAGGELSFPVEFGKTYTLEISGDTASGLAAAMTGTD